MVRYYSFDAESMLNNKEFEAGSLYFCTDTKRLFLDPEGGNARILVGGDPIIVSTETDRESILAPIPDKLYIVLESGITYVYHNGTWNNVSSSSYVKAGLIYINPSSVLPNGFLWCDGAAYSRTQYPELFAAIGTVYGSGDGSTTFNVPNLSTRVPVGSGNGFELGAMSTVETENDVITIVNMDESDEVSTDKHLYTVVNYCISTGKGSGVNVSEILAGVQALPLGIEYGGFGGTTAEVARQNIGAASIEDLNNALANIPNGIPECTTSDNGKFLRVVNGTATWQSIQNAEEMTF